MNFLKTISTDLLCPKKELTGFELGTVLDHSTQFRLSEEQLSTHSCVLGASGSGKSKFLELLMRYLLVGKRGFALIDPHGDLSEDLLAYAGYLRASKREPEIARRIHYLEPSFERVFSFDPFHFRSSKPIREEFAQNAYSAWLRAKADRVAEIFQRKQNQPNFEGMPRLQRVLTDVLIAAGTMVDGDRDDRLPLADAMVLLDFSKVNREQHLRVFGRIRPYLEPEIARDFERIQSYNSDEQRLRETESTINRLRSLFSPIVKAIFSRQTESIDFRAIVQSGHVLLINLRETEYFSADQRRALGGLFIHEILSTAQNEPRESRKPFHLFVDEAAEFVGDDINNALAVMRKFKLSICLAAQNLDSFKKGEVDLRAKVLSQCGTKICFNQSVPDDTEILARVLASGNLSFERYQQIVDRPDGYDWVDVIERSESSQDGTSWSDGESKSVAKSKGTSSSKSESVSHGVSQSRSTTDGESYSSSEGVTRSIGSSQGTSVPIDPDSENLGTRHQSWTESGGTTATSTSGRSESVTLMQGESSTRSIGTSVAKTHSSSVSVGQSHSKGGSQSQGESTSYRKVPLSRHREEFHEQPSLRTAISDQIEQIRQVLSIMPRRVSMVKLLDSPKAMLIRTADVKEKWNEEEKHIAVARMKELSQEKPYFAIADFGPEAADARVKTFLGDEPRIEIGVPDDPFGA